MFLCSPLRASYTVFVRFEWHVLKCVSHLSESLNQEKDYGLHSRRMAGSKFSYDVRTASFNLSNHSNWDYLNPKILVPEGSSLCSECESCNCNIRSLSMRIISCWTRPHVFTSFGQLKKGNCLELFFQSLVNDDVKLIEYKKSQLIYIQN